MCVRPCDSTMVIPFESRELRYVRLDGARRQDCVQQFRRCRQQMGDGLDVGALCVDASRAFDGYALQTLEALRRVNRGDDQRSAWVAAHYYDGISSVAIALRDQIEDAAARHAVAQKLQERVLRAELRFHHAMRPGSYPVLGNLAK